MIFPQKTINCKGRLLDLSSPHIMGILNVTPDSFFSDSRIANEETLLKRAAKMLKEGATILDVGGMSSRPGAAIISVQEELDRVLPAISSIHKAMPEAIISIDTVHATVAQEAVAAGAAIVNDISAGKIDPEMYATVAALGVPYILMHMKGQPSNMQEQTADDDINGTVLNFLIQEVHQLRQLGVKDIILDPGFGFGKTIDQNYSLLKHLHLLQTLDCPILAGLSRKSMIYKYLHNTASTALNGTSVLNTIALQQGASILRVHDVKAAKEVILLWEKLETTSL